MECNEIKIGIQMPTDAIVDELDTFQTEFVVGL